MRPLSGDARVLTVSLLYREKKPLNLSVKYWTGSVRAKSLQSCPTLCHPVDHSPPGCSVHEILQARILERVVTPSCRGSSWSRDRTHISASPALAGRFFTTAPPWKPQIVFTTTMLSLLIYGLRVFSTFSISCTWYKPHFPNYSISFSIPHDA